MCIVAVLFEPEVDRGTTISRLQVMVSPWPIFKNSLPPGPAMELDSFITNGSKEGFLVRAVNSLRAKSSYYLKQTTATLCHLYGTLRLLRVKEI